MVTPGVIIGATSSLSTPCKNSQPKSLFLEMLCLNLSWNNTWKARLGDMSQSPLTWLIHGDCQRGVFPLGTVVKLQMNAWFRRSLRGGVGGLRAEPFQSDGAFCLQFTGQPLHGDSVQHPQCPLEVGLSCFGLDWIGVYFLYFLDRHTVGRGDVNDEGCLRRSHHPDLSMTRHT